jgi:hypothetical protein
VSGMSPVVTIARVCTDGSVERLGEWHDTSRTLVLQRAGFPFLSAGTHHLESRLPWIFSDMAPAGFLGARFSRGFPELRLPERTRDWSDSQVLTAISRRGEDLSGNLLVGDESIQRFHDLLAPALRAGSMTDDDYAHAIDAFLRPDGVSDASSLGGERPKLVLHAVGAPDPSDHLLKFTPPLNTSFGKRWNDLLVFEILCGSVLAGAGIDTATRSDRASYVQLASQRAGVVMRRFDRVGLLGRRGAATLYFLALVRDEFHLEAPALMRSLARDGLVPEADAATVERVHAFSRAIGNTDAHLGNYALQFDDAGRARLAPIYDVTAMVFAPVADELPDTRVQPRSTPVPETVAPLVTTLLERVRRDERLSVGFVEQWLRYVGA